MNVKLPEIAGFTQALNESNNALYRHACPGEHYRTGDNLELVVEQKEDAITTERVFILDEVPPKFQFGDVVCYKNSWTVHYVCQVGETNQVRVVNQSGKFGWTGTSSLKLQHTVSQGSLDETIQILNKGKLSD